MSQKISKYKYQLFSAVYMLTRFNQLRKWINDLKPSCV